MWPSYTPSKEDVTMVLQRSGRLASKALLLAVLLVSYDVTAGADGVSRVTPRLLGRTGYDADAPHTPQRLHHKKEAHRASGLSRRHICSENGFIDRPFGGKK
ncbi:hypothetical protein SKAU_G00380630 [Synaphobranchus kaupii]|uniref:Uncharacterized protein n=1 Tax=Synaphobranchus kaupii TaxID=118154 RepID=A0A9Q1EDN0_SYNKA|nr:hypothetical protein SKAU_G00380630 [Synaphobranchus kaupii]